MLAVAISDIYCKSSRFETILAISPYGLGINVVKYLQWLLSAHCKQKLPSLMWPKIVASFAGTCITFIMFIIMFIT